MYPPIVCSDMGYYNIIFTLAKGRKKKKIESLTPPMLLLREQLKRKVKKVGGKTFYAFPWGNGLMVAYESDKSDPPNLYVLVSNKLSISSQQQSGHENFGKFMLIIKSLNRIDLSQQVPTRILGLRPPSLSIVYLNLGMSHPVSIQVHKIFLVAISDQKIFAIRFSHKRLAFLRKISN